MSEFIGQAQGVANQLAILGNAGFGWRAGLRAATYRGVPFYVTETASDDGRRVALHVFPLRDASHTEDMGRTARRYRITGYVIGEAYFADRDALVEACAGSAEAGTLTHPFLGELRVRCEAVSYRESLKEGRFATFEITFIDASEEATPTEAVDTLRATLSAAAQAMRLARSVYSLAARARGDLTGFAQGVVAAYLGPLGVSLGLSWLSLPRFNIGGISAALAALAASPVTDPDEVAGVLPAPYLALAVAVPLPVAVPAAGTAFASRLDAELLAEPLALLLAETARRAPSSPDATEALALAAVFGLSQDAVVVAAAQAAVEADWPNADAALAARDRVLSALWLREDAAADAGADDLYAAWRALAAALRTDLTDRAARLPRRGVYTLAGSLPALALSQRLYGTAARADELLALSGVPHPAVLPAAGTLLRP